MFVALSEAALRNDVPTAVPMTMLLAVPIDVSISTYFHADGFASRETPGTPGCPYSCAYGSMAVTIAMPIAVPVPMPPGVSLGLASGRG